MQSGGRARVQLAIRALQALYRLCDFVHQITLNDMICLLLLSGQPSCINAHVMTPDLPSSAHLRVQRLRLLVQLLHAIQPPPGSGRLLPRAGHPPRSPP